MCERFLRRCGAMLGTRFTPLSIAKPILRPSRCGALVGPGCLKLSRSIAATHGARYTQCVMQTPFMCCVSEEIKARHRDTAKGHGAYPPAAQRSRSTSSSEAELNEK